MNSKLKTLVIKVPFAIKIVVWGILSSLTIGLTQSEELIKLRLSYNANGGQTPQYVAGTRGIFKQYGLDVERLEFRTQTDAASALQAGRLEIMGSIPSSVWSAREAGFDMVAFMQNETAGFSEPDSGTLMVRNDSGIDSLEGLRGKVIACLSLGSQACLNAIYLLDEVGLRRDEYTITSAPFSAHYDLLNNNRVDAVVTVDPFSTRIKSAGFGKVVSYIYIDTNPGQPLGAWWGNRVWVEENPEIVDKFSLAIKDAIDYLNEDEVRAREIVAEYTGMNVELLQNMPSFNWNYIFDPSVWQKQAEILIQAGGLKELPNPDEYFAEHIYQYEVQ